MKLLKLLYSKLFKWAKNDDVWHEYLKEDIKKVIFSNKSIYEYLKEGVGADTDYIALNYFNTKISFQELFDRIDLASKSLRALGVKPKDIVSICMPNTPEAVIMFYAINNIGAIADMIHPLLAPIEIKKCLELNKSKVMILFDANYVKMKDLLNGTHVKKVILASVSESMPLSLKLSYQLLKGLKIKKPKRGEQKYVSWIEFLDLGYVYRGPIVGKMKAKDTALILHSGGTTGVPKGVMISNYSFNALAKQGSINVQNVCAQDKIVTILPIFHGFGLGVCIHCPLCLKVEVILMPEFDSKRFIKILKKNQPNVLAGVPTLWNAIISNPKFEKIDLSSLKYVISGGDYLTISLEEKMNNYLRSNGATIAISKGYGMTESVAATAYTFESVNELGSIGIPMVNNKFCICKPYTEEELPLGEEGEICVWGPTIMQGYFKNPFETKKVLRKHKDGKVWLHTGDMGYITGAGIIYFTQRLKRIIISSGFNVYPNIIEEVIERHPLVLKCCVIGIKHPYKVQVAKAFIVLKKQKVDQRKVLEEIKSLCQNNLAKYSWPKEYEFRDSLPKTIYNKIDYLKLEQEEHR